MSALHIAAAAAGLAYLVAGLFVSRYMWRRYLVGVSDWDGSSETTAFAVILVWPLVIAGLGVHKFAKWFYTT